MSNENLSIIIYRNPCITLARSMFRSNIFEWEFDRFTSFFLFVIKLRDAARKLLEKELDHLHKNHDAWQIFVSKWSHLFNQSYSKENDGALYDQDIRDIYLDEMSCKK